MIPDFSKNIISLLEIEVPSLKDKIQLGAVDATIKAPYAALSLSEQEPIRTKDGILGYTQHFELNVYDKRVRTLEELKSNIISALEGSLIQKHRCRYISGQYDYFADYDLHGYSLSFILK